MKAHVDSIAAIVGRGIHGDQNPIGLAIAALIGIPCLFYAPDLLRLMGASSAALAEREFAARWSLSSDRANVDQWPWRHDLPLPKSARRGMT